MADQTKKKVHSHTTRPIRRTQTTKLPFPFLFYNAYPPSESPELKLEMELALEL
jgi:hypothetical protein